jgi:hypothetical protein
MLGGDVQFAAEGSQSRGDQAAADEMMDLLESGSDQNSSGNETIEVAGKEARHLATPEEQPPQAVIRSYAGRRRIPQRSCTSVIDVMRRLATNDRRKPSPVGEALGNDRRSWFA